MSYLIERFWFDPSENQNAFGWNPVGVVTEEYIAKNISKIEGPKIIDHPWPLLHVERDSSATHIPAYRYSPLRNLDVAALDDAIPELKNIGAKFDDKVD